MNPTVVEPESERSWDLEENEINEFNDVDETKPTMCRPVLQ